MNGVCINNVCQCQSGYVCDNCNKKRDDIITGKDKCSCSEKCKKGSCKNGKCICKSGYSGYNCDIDICDVLACEEGECDREKGKCICKTGYTGVKCNELPTGGGSCSTSAECGYFDGGICNNKTLKCECYDGWTCPYCDRQGNKCNTVVRSHGGGKCKQSKDCGNFGPNYRNPLYTGGQCKNGICQCYEGYTCPHCDIAGDIITFTRNGGKCSSNSIRYAISYILLFNIIILFI